MCQSKEVWVVGHTRAWWFFALTTSAYTASSTIFTSVAQVSQDTHSQGHIIQNHFLVFMSLFLSSDPPRSLDSALWYEILFSFSSEFFSFLSDRVWWDNVFWQADPRFEPLKVKSTETWKSQCTIFIQRSWVHSDVFLVLITEWQNCHCPYMCPLQNYKHISYSL